MTDGHKPPPTNAWSGRFSAAPDALLEAFNASVEFDIRLVREDIRGSIAHARMLGRQGIIPPADAADVEAGLWRVLAEVDAGTFRLTLADEDVHTGGERRLRELIGVVTGKLHTARSRNDQVATSLRLWTKSAIVALTTGVLDLRETLLAVAATHAATVMPGYTHLQHAQPILLAHHLHAYVAMFERDAERLRDAYRRTDVLPLGSGALAGVTFPIDRAWVATDLGFSQISANSLDVVADRDFVLDVMMACAVIGLHLSRLSEEIILWTTTEFRFMTLSDSFSTGSSIMPQKKNPDVAELARGKSGRLIGDLMAMLTVIKGLPLTYNKDLQEDKEGLFDAVDTTLTLLTIFPPMLRTARFHEERLAEMAIADFALATDAADHLARHGVPFREAHEVIGRLVASCVAEGRAFADLNQAEWAAVHRVFAQSPPPLTVAESVAARDVPGGTAPNQVRAAQEHAQTRLGAERAWLEARQDEMTRTMHPPSETRAGD
ncbi:MAG: argininosuccinate lyase [Chloroflexota bacterium]|nr:argininosuccinate lyase [Chloroflexota bacterium]